MELLRNIKLAIFDFDNTLAKYKNNVFDHRNENEGTYYINAYLYPDSFYDGFASAYPPDEMKKLVDCCMTKGIPLYCITGMRFTLHLEAKKSFIKNYYGDAIEVIATANQERKKDVVILLKRIYQCEFNEILFVDDYYDNIMMMKQIGVKAILSKNVSNLLNDGK